MLVPGHGPIVAVTEYEVRADAGPRLLTSIDVVETLEAQGIVIDPEILNAHHPLPGIAGSKLTAGATSVAVYVCISVAARMADEQIIQRQETPWQALTTGSDQPLGITPVRNILLLYCAESAGNATAIQHTAPSFCGLRSLTPPCRDSWNRVCVSPTGSPMCVPLALGTDTEAGDKLL